MEEPYKTIGEMLNEIEPRLENYLHVMNALVAQSTVKVPSTPSKVAVGTVIYRSRRHSYPNVVFWHKRCLNYLPDPAKAKIGRANLPEAPVFYGAFSSEEQPEGWGVANREVDAERFRPVETFTSSVWRVIKEFEVLPIIVSKEQAGRMKVAQRMYESIQEQLAAMPEPEQTRTRELFAAMEKEFTEERTGVGYLKSASFAHILYQQFAGVSYPSVRTKFEAFNVAILPHIADTHLRFEGAMMGQYQFGRISGEPEPKRVGVNYWITRSENGEPFAWTPLDRKYATLASGQYIPWGENDD